MTRLIQTAMALMCVVIMPSAVGFNDGDVSMQFDKQTVDNPMVSFFGSSQDANTILVDAVILKSRNQPEGDNATGQCIGTREAN
jgi:hypothetical protein